MTDPRPVAHNIGRALEDADITCSSPERVGDSNWIIRITDGDRHGALRVAVADSRMLRPDVISLLDAAGWSPHRQLGDIALLQAGDVPIATRVHDAVAQACTRLDIHPSARRAACAALNPDIATDTEQLISVAMWAIRPWDDDAESLPARAGHLTERLRPFGVPQFHIDGIAWQIIIEGFDPADLAQLPHSTLLEASPGARELVVAGMSKLLLKNPAAPADMVRAATWDLLRPYPLVWRTRQAEWLDWWAVSPEWRSAVADSHLRDVVLGEPTTLAASAAFRQVAHALIPCDRAALAAIALATWPNADARRAWVIVSAAQASLVDPYELPSDLDADDRTAAAPYRTHADLLAEMRAITDEGVEPTLRLRNPDLVAARLASADATIGS